MGQSCDYLEVTLLKWIKRSLSMKIKESLFSSAIILFLSSMIHAQPSVLPPGARIIAGDLNNNEFFILDKDEALPVKTIPHQSIVQKQNNKTVVPSKRIAEKRLVKNGTKTPSKLLNKKNISQIQRALNKKTTQSITSPTKTRFTSKQVQIKGTNKKKKIVLQRSPKYISFKVKEYASNRVIKKEVMKKNN